MCPLDAAGEAKVRQTLRELWVDVSLAFTLSGQGQKRAAGISPGRSCFSRRSTRRRVLAVDPRAFELLVVRRRRAMLPVSPAFQPMTWFGLPRFLLRASQLRRPRRVGLASGPASPCPRTAPCRAVALHAHVHRRERGGAEFRRAERLALAVAHALQEVLPQRVGRVAVSSSLSNVVDRLLLAVAAPSAWPGRRRCSGRTPRSPRCSRRRR